MVIKKTITSYLFIPHGQQIIKHVESLYAYLYALIGIRQTRKSWTAIPTILALKTRIQ